MIKPQEIRIGNYYQGASRGNIEIVTWQTLRDLSEGKLNLLPIPLTEEILLKFGFEKTANPRELKYDDYSILLLDEIRFVICNYMENPPSVKVSTLHQLQNLFFSLTGEELTFKN